MTELQRQDQRPQYACWYAESSRSSRRSSRIASRRRDFAARFSRLVCDSGPVHLARRGSRRR